MEKSLSRLLRIIRRFRPGLSLFWRTFFFLSILLGACTAAWIKVAIELEAEPRAIQSAQQISSHINLSRTALIHADPIYRIALIKAIALEEGIRIVPREPTDDVLPYLDDRLNKRLKWALLEKLGSNTVVSSSVNKKTGLWVSFDIDGDNYWLQTDPSRITPITSEAWVTWLFVTVGLSLFGSALIADLINEPLKKLAEAISSVQKGNFTHQILDENIKTTEIRTVNRGFNLMAKQLAKLEHDRVLLLAGLSHDLRTPLTRIRLEAEMSIQDPDARLAMTADIDQLDQMIGKFLEYARPLNNKKVPVELRSVVNVAFQHVSRHKEGPKIATQNCLPENFWVMGDELELNRVFVNLCENARRYGKTPDLEPIQVQIEVSIPNTSELQKTIPLLNFPEFSMLKWVLLRDHGSGVKDNELPHLLTPFYRADNSRSEAIGSGLGLSIVERVVNQIGGKIFINNHPKGGLAIYLGFPASLAPVVTV